MLGIQQTSSEVHNGPKPMAWDQYDVHTFGYIILWKLLLLAGKSVQLFARLFNGSSTRSVISSLFLLSRLLLLFIASVVGLAATPNNFYCFCCKALINIKGNIKSVTGFSSLYPCLLTSASFFRRPSVPIASTPAHKRKYILLYHCILFESIRFYF